jgi:hypothetical protein
MTQALYAHMNNKTIKKNKKSFSKDKDFLRHQVCVLEDFIPPI